MSNFDTNKHPRNHPNNAGAFSEKTNSEPEGSLAGPVPTAVRPEVEGQIRFEKWVDDNAVTVGSSDPFDMGKVLDTYSLDEVRGFQREGSGGQDELFERAQTLGLAPTHDGPFTVEVDDDLLLDYIAERVTNDQRSPLTSITAPAVVQARVDRELAEVAETYARINAHLFELGKTGAEAVVKQRYPDAASLTVVPVPGDNENSDLEAERIQNAAGDLIWEFDSDSQDDSLFVGDLLKYTTLLTHNLGELEALDDDECRLHFAA